MLASRAAMTNWESGSPLPVMAEPELGHPVATMHSLCVERLDGRLKGGHDEEQ